MKEKFSLKDHLFNPAKVTYLAGRINTAHHKFDDNLFIKQVLDKFPKLELKERIVWMRKCLKGLLPDDYQTSVNILLQSLPEECDPNKTDDDFGDFIFAPFGDFVAAYGCDATNLEFSLQALQEMTKRFSAEDAIRYFINVFPDDTLSQMATWSGDKNYHIRRLASEGTRPKLPWSQKISLDNRKVIKMVLDNLYFDKTRYVVRSVANHLNDISKNDPKLVVNTLIRWRKSRLQEKKELEYLTKHALRTLVKKGDKDALKLLGYKFNPAIHVSDFKILTREVKIGESLRFTFNIKADKIEQLMIDYMLYFQSKSGVLSPKVFKIKTIMMDKSEVITVNKKHPLRIMTTKKLYPGVHKVSLQINGNIYSEGVFDLYE